MCHSRCTVHAGLFFCLSRNIQQKILFVFCKLQLLQDFFITFHNLAGCKAKRNLSLFCMILNQMHHCMNSSMDSLLFPAKIRFCRTFLIFCHMNGMTD
ncbi:hypothetical protein EVA_16522 [gut metagenome]|uniref:Uncharacterized protein n=1 Tax=gut metagenome TaxID=749906 RepID=J9G0N8_9ZZZZ